MKRMKTGIVCAALVIALAGCATTGGGVSKEELIQQTIETWRAGLLEQDIDKMMSAFSESFSNSQTSDLAQVRSFFEDAMGQGYLEDAEIDYRMEDGKFEEENFVIYPVLLEGPAGNANIELVLSEENGQWLIISLEIEA